MLAPAHAAAAAVADFVGARADDVVFVDNATSGLNAVLCSLALAAGDEIVILDHAYGTIVNVTAFIQVDREPDHIGRRAPVSLGLVGDVRATLAALAPKLKGDSSPFRTGLLTLREWLAQTAEQASLARTDEPLHSQLFARAISDRAVADTIFACDVGECTVWLARQVSLAGAGRSGSRRTI